MNTDNINEEMLINYIDYEKYNLNLMPDEIKVSTMTVYVYLNCKLKFDDIKQMILESNNPILISSKISNLIIKLELKSKISFKITMTKQNFLMILGCKGFNNANLKINKILNFLLENNLIEKNEKKISVIDLSTPLINCDFKVDNFNLNDKEFENFGNFLIKKNTGLIETRFSTPQSVVITININNKELKIYFYNLSKKGIISNSSSDNEILFGYSFLMKKISQYIDSKKKLQILSVDDKFIELNNNQINKILEDLN